MQNMISGNSLATSPFPVLIPVLIPVSVPVTQRLKTVRFCGTYKFSIDLCQVCMAFFPFCIISAVGQIAVSTQSLGYVRADMAARMFKWLNVEMVDGFCKGNLQLTQTQLLRQSLRFAVETQTRLLLTLELALKMPNTNTIVTATVVVATATNVAVTVAEA